jgi:hypothetical protein
VIEFDKEILKNLAENHIMGLDAYPKWDKANRHMRNHAIKAWEE